MLIKDYDIHNAEIYQSVCVGVLTVEIWPFFWVHFRIMFENTDLFYK